MWLHGLNCRERLLVIIFIIVGRYRSLMRVVEAELIRLPRPWPTSSAVVVVCEIRRRRGGGWDLDGVVERVVALAGAHIAGKELIADEEG